MNSVICVTWVPILILRNQDETPVVMPSKLRPEEWISQAKGRVHGARARGKKPEDK